MAEPTDQPGHPLDEELTGLLEEVRRGNLGAFKAIYEHYARRILNFAFKLLGNREEAEDVTQDTFTAAFHKIQSLKDDTRFEAWLYRIARNYIYQHYRQRSVEHVSIDRDEDTDQDIEKLIALDKNPEEKVLKGELYDVAGRIIRSLPEKYREVFILSALQGLSYQDIADIVGKSLPAVKTDIHRARLEVRRKLKKYLGTIQGEDDALL